MKNIKIYLPVILLPIWIIIYINLQFIADFITYDLIQLEIENHLSQSINFFLFEVPKVMMLLVLIIFIIGIIRSYFSAEKTRKILEGKSLFTGNILAAILGIVTPFCSCSAIPLFLGFIEAGIPIGVTFSFLIAAPMINEVALIMLIGLFGWKVALIYVSTGLVIAIISGFIIEKLKMQKYVEAWVFKVKSNQITENEPMLHFQQRIEVGWDSVKEIISKIWLYIVAGIAIGAIAHGYVPSNLLSEVLGTGCTKCKKVEKITRNAVEEMGIKASIEKVEDMLKIMQYGVMRTPAIVINEKVVLSGKVPSKKEITELITQSQTS